MDDRKLLLGFIERNLPDMAKDFDEGLGIASERYFFNKIIEKNFKSNVPATVLNVL